MTEGQKKLKAQGSNPEAPGKKQLRGKGGEDAAEMPVDGSGEEEAGQEQQNLALLSGPPPWWRQAMRLEREEIVKATEAAVGRSLLGLNDEIGELREEIKDVRQQAERSAVAASEAHEQIRAMKAEMQKRMTEERPQEGETSRQDAARAAKLPDRRKAVPARKLQEGELRSEIESSDDEAEGKELEMVIAGFSYNTPCQDVRDDIEVILNTVKPPITMNRTSIRTTRKMTSFGIVKFTLQREKAQFKNWLSSLKEPLQKHGKKLRLGDNEDKEEREKGRAIAKVVRALYENKEKRKDITRDYHNHEV